MLVDAVISCFHNIKCRIPSRTKISCNSELFVSRSYCLCDTIFRKKIFFLFFFLFMTDRHTLIFAGTFREQFWFFSELRINKSKITASHRHSGYILQNSSNTPVCYSSLDIVSFPSFITLLGLKKDGFPRCDELSQSHRHYMIWNSCMPEYSGTAKFISCNVKAEKHNLSEIKLLTMWYIYLFFSLESFACKGW